MQSLQFGDQKIKIPAAVARRFKGRKLIAVETTEGLLIKPDEDPIASFRGCLKGKMTMEDFHKLRAEDRQLEK